VKKCSDSTLLILSAKHLYGTWKRYAMGSRKDRKRRPFKKSPNVKVRPKQKWVKMKKKIRFKKKKKKR